MYELIVIRHGQSEYNAKKIFTGWSDPGLTAKGVAEAIRAGEILKEKGYVFDVAYTSLQTRAIKTLYLAMESMNQLYLPVIKDYRINERCYGALQTHTHAEKIEEFGEEQVFTWRRDYETRPPALDLDDPRHPRHDPRYKNLPDSVLPSGESLADTVARVKPYMQQEILPKVAEGKKIILSAHGNSIRALVMLLEGITPEEIRTVNIPTGVPMVFTFDEDMNFVSREYLEG